MAFNQIGQGIFSEESKKTLVTLKHRDVMTPSFHIQKPVWSEYRNRETRSASAPTAKGEASQNNGSLKTKAKSKVNSRH